jgi:cytochrome c6
MERKYVARDLVMAAVVMAIVCLMALPLRSQGGGEALYKTKCAACHGPDGKGETAIGKANKLRDFGSAEVQKQSDEELSEMIGKGKGKMPAYGKSLKPEQIKDLVAYVRTFKK